MSPTNPTPLLGRQANAIAILAVSILGYALGVTLFLRVTGLPIDDAYIYQSYARNLAGGGGFAFNAGETSFGATSVIWTLLLGLCNRLFFWVEGPFIAQAICLTSWAATLILLQRIVLMLTKSIVPAVACGLALVFLPAAFLQGLSGMETQTAAALFFFTVHELIRVGFTQPKRLGLYTGLLYLFRADMLWILLTILLFRIVAGRREESDEWPTPKGYWTRVLGCFILTVLPITLFVWIESGRIMPTSFYGKAISSQAGLYYWSAWKRLVVTIAIGWGGLMDAIGDSKNWLFAQPIAWLGALGAAKYILYYFIRGRNSLTGSRLALGLLAATLGVPFLFALFLPIYPHSGGYFHRYFAVTTQSVWVLGILMIWWAIFILMKRWVADPEEARRKAGWALGAACGLMILANAWNLPRNYNQLASDYEKIVGQNTEVRGSLAAAMSENLPTDARVLVGNSGLGTIGYYSNRYCLDGGALINPDIFPYFEKIQTQREIDRKEWKQRRWGALRQYMIDKDLQYWVVLPDDFGSVFAEGELTRLMSVRIDQERAWDGLTGLALFQFNDPAKTPMNPQPDTTEKESENE